MGYENSVSQCSKTQYPSVTCPTNYFAEIRCYEGDSIKYIYFYNYSSYYSDCIDGDIRLTGGLTGAEGTIEICRGNLWGLVSEIGWTNNEAQVVCRQLGVDSQS